MKKQYKFTFSLMRCTKTNNIFSIGKNTDLGIYFLGVNTQGYDSKLIRIDKKTFDCFFLSELNEINQCFTKLIVI